MVQDTRCPISHCHPSFCYQLLSQEATAKRTELETELVITQFASQINRHKHVDELLWDVTKNCISRLHFEDCVIYLKDERNDVLVQKAAYGPKSPVDLTIHQPIEIPVGKGIVGTVAQTGKPELVNDTEKDSRYIVDDERRFSELAVPIIIDGMVAGVIDSEHSRKNFSLPGSYRYYRLYQCFVPTSFRVSKQKKRCRRLLSNCWKINERPWKAGCKACACK